MRYSNILLFSGGLDSTVVATMLKRSGCRTLLVHVDQGIRRHRLAATAIADRLGMPLHVCDLTSVTRSITRESAYIPGHRMWLYLSALSVADAHHADAIYTGEIAFPDDPDNDRTNKDFHNYLEGSNDVTQEAWKSNRQRFVELYSNMFENAVDAYDIIDPLWGMRKREVVALGVTLGAPLYLTSSCRNPTEYEDCKICWACQSRQRALLSANVDF